jgi:hypothetical protein
MVEAAMNGMEAYLTTIVPGQTPCLSCFFPEKPDWDKRGFSVVGAVSGALACLTALEAIKLITGFGTPLLSQLMTMDLNSLEFAKRRSYRDPGCPVCGNNAPWRHAHSKLQSDELGTKAPRTGRQETQGNDFSSVLSATLPSPALRQKPKHLKLTSSQFASAQSTGDRKR